MKQRLVVTLRYEYDMDTDHYPEDMQDDPLKMAMLDIEVDPSIVTYGTWTVSHAELRPPHGISER